MNSRLQGARVLLTGASRGIGRAVARNLLEAGSSLLGVARNEERLATAIEELSSLGSGTIEGLAVDLASPEAPAPIYDRIDGLWGAVDIVIHNAGVMLPGDGALMSGPDDILERSLEVNLLSPLRISRALLPLLEAGNEPRIVNVGSGAGTIEGLAGGGIAGYRLSKWAVNGMTMLQASELAGVVSVIAFDAGWVRTDMGGPHAPGTPEDAADGLMKTLDLPWDVTGEFYKDGRPIPW